MSFPFKLFRPAKLACVGALAATLLAGCATYQAEPLPEQAASADSLTQLHGYDSATSPMDAAAVERLVLLNNPDLRTAHARHEAAQAQRRQDSVLPNPVIGGSVGYLMSGPGDATAWTASISEDITALITLKPRREAAKASADAVDAGLLWEQWQTVGKARLLVIDLVEQARLIRWQQQALDLLAQREARLTKAIGAGTMERITTASDLAAAADARANLNDLQRRQLDQQQQLAALLGLKPEVVVPLVESLAAPTLDADAIRQQADSVRHRRPDLVALQLGYQAQDATLRAAVLSQFPALSLGYAASQDNSRVRNGGPAVTFTLPLFDRNQGNIAVARASREQLHIEYTTRLATSRDDVDALLAQYAQLEQQRQALTPAAADAARAASQAEAAWHAGLLDLRGYVDLDVASINRQMALIAIEQAMLEQQAALALLVGRGMPVSLDQDVIGS
ncbi:TolC family protein [Dyella solisilvae]|uniref:TolC family protein n=1 Tax=Dyella solisilvae TaxID=1920168 RepID=A0A370K7Q6_9GAMM|nr:TolC family protein [Dyella solisilvae]RDI98663.1 TolC family protein [Dyella solisilvae]